MAAGEESDPAQARLPTLSGRSVSVEYGREKAFHLTQETMVFLRRFLGWRNGRDGRWRRLHVPGINDRELSGLLHRGRGCDPGFGTEDKRRLHPHVDVVRSARRERSAFTR